MQAIDILAWRNGFDHAARIEPVGQRQLQQDAVDGGIGIKLFDQGEQLRLARRRGKVVLDRMKPAGLRGLDREARLQSLRGERAGIFRRAITCSDARLPSIRRALERILIRWTHIRHCENS